MPSAASAARRRENVRAAAVAPDAEREDGRVLEQQQEIGNATGAALLDQRALQRRAPPRKERCRAAGLRERMRPTALQHARIGVEVLELLLDVGHELVGDGAVDQSVVVAERQVRHRPDRDRVVDDDRPLLDRADAENRHLRLVDDRHAELRAELPGLVMVNVPPCTSSGLSCLARARSATSAIARLRPSMFFSSAFLMTGTIKPSSSATAMPRLMSFL